MLCKKKDGIIKIKNILSNYVLNNFSLFGNSRFIGKRKNISMLFFYFLLFYRVQAVLK